MLKTMTAKLRGQKIFFLILLPVVILGLLGLFALSGAGEVRTGAAYSGGFSENNAGQRRNNIYDRNFDTLALSFRLNSLYARPLEIADPEGTAAELARLLDLDREDLLDSLRSQRSFVWLDRQVEKEKAQEVLAAEIQGVYDMPRSHRYYPNHDEASHAIGFVKDGQGLAGLELSYENILRGGVSDARLVAAGVPERAAADGGVHLISTLDLSIQRELEQRLARVLRTVDGSFASALVMDVSSGAVVAMASLPSYDPNNFWAAGAEERVNRAVVPRVRPGALRDMFSRAAAIDARDWAAFDLLPGERERAGQGWWQPLEPDVYAPAGQKLAGGGSAKMLSREFLNQVGLCQVSDMDLLEGHTREEIMPLKGGREGDCRQLFQDNRVAVSGVSLLAAFSRLVNSGRPVDPHLIRGFWDGEQFWPRQTVEDGRALPVDTGRAVLEDLLRMVDPRGAVATYESLVAQSRPRDHFSPAPARYNGKSGEGGSLAEQQDAGAAGETARPRYQAVLLGMAPVDDPALAALVFVDGARLDLDLPSPLSGVVRNLDIWSVNLLPRSPEPPEPGTIAAREESLYRQWQGMREEGELQVRIATSPAPGTMPDVTGFSLRKALQVLQSSGLRLQVRGSGRVVSQQPEPGASLRGVDEGVIELRVPADQMAAVGIRP